MVLYATEYLPIAATSVMACLALAIFGVLPINGAFAGFGNDIVYLIVGMVIVGNALFETGVAKLIGQKIISAVGTNERLFMLALVPVTTAISMFLSNTATASIVLPLVASAVAASGGKLTKKNTFMMVGILAVTGGGLTLVGSTPQLIAQGFLVDGGHGAMGFFEIARTGLPILLLLVLYYQTIGLVLQKKFFTFPEVEDAPAVPAGGGSPTTVGVGTATIEEKPKSVAKMIISVCILAFCIIGFLRDLWSPGVVAMVGAVACVATGCLSQKQLFAKMDWTTVTVMGASFGISAGMQQSGAGALVAQTAINIMGDNVTPWLLWSTLVIISTILTNFMSSTATAALLVPIAGMLAIELGFDVKPVVMAVAVAANVGYATPVSTPPVTMTLVAGYRFKDYVVLGGLFNVLAIALLILIYPIVF